MEIYDHHQSGFVTYMNELEEECGLYPMSDFVLEKNFRYRMDDTTLGLLESLTDVVDPRFEIVKVLARISSTGENYMR